MTDEEFACFHKDKYCSPTAHLEGRRRIELLEELAEALANWRRVGHLEVVKLEAHYRLEDAEAAIV